MRIQFIQTFLAVAVLVLPCSAVVAQGEKANSTGIALSSMFDVQRAPKAKSMGLFQANFLDSLKTARRSLQLAVVIDSTESMSGEIDSIRSSLPELLSDLSRFEDGALETTVVTYSDVGESEHPATIISPGFVSDATQMTNMLEQISTASGKPYFPEAVDLGVFTAIDQLPWSPDENVEKWLLLIGDAPPYDPSFHEAETKAQRWYETDFLIDFANKKNLKIHCLLCSSRDVEKKAYEESLVKTRRFMSQLADGTGGQMLDLSYPFVRERLVANASARKSEYSRIGYITQSEIDAVANQHQVVDSSNDQVIRIAVLPFLPLESMTFLYEKPEVQMATELRQRLQALPNVRTISPRQVEEEILRLQGEGGPVTNWPTTLNIRLRTDYVLHGSMRLADSASLEASVFGRDQSSSLTQFATSGAIESLAGSLLSELKQTKQRPESLQPLLQRLATIEKPADNASTQIAMLQNLNKEERSQLLGAFEALEQSLGYSLGDELGEELLEKAELELEKLLATRPEHAFAHALRASCLYNQAKIEEGRGQLEQAKTMIQRSNDAIKEAYRLRNQLVDRLTRLEVEADFALMVAKDYPGAISAYEQIVSFSEASPVQSALRAHWMLAGIFNGAWDVAKNDSTVANPEKAKQHIIQILAFWPDSVEAVSIKRYLLWDDQNNKSRTPYLPIESDLLTSND